MAFLECKKVSKNFGGLAAVSNVDLAVEKGEIVGLIGPNGAGKSTLFNLISGAIPLKSGTITFQDKVISGLKPHEICAMGIARTFQTAKVFGSMPAVPNVMLGALFGKSPRVSAKEGERIALESLEFVGLSGLADTLAKDMTMVNQKRLEVARALATRPDLLMLDEVMAGLNPTEVSEAMELVKKIRARNITVVMIEHVMKAIMSICDRIVVLNHGVKIAEGTPQEIASNSTVIEVYLGE